MNPIENNGENNNSRDFPDGPPRILVADDEPAHLQAVGGMLGRQGYEIMPATDGPTALKRLELHQPDLIVLNMSTPGMDGLELCHRIRENPEWKDIPIMFLSAMNDTELIVAALEAGGVDYVSKPYNQAEVLSRIRNHLALKRARDRLKQLAEDKDELLGILAHDLKSHLGGVQMSAEILRNRLEQSGDSKQQQLCSNICRSTGQLLAFVKEFLANAATDHGINLKLEPVNLSGVINRAVQDYQEAARRKHLIIRTTLPPQAIVVNADRGALSQVLDNLISNAVKFSPPEKEILVSVKQDGDSIECQVQDQGPGFSAEDKARMFRRYRRLSARPTGGEPSSGLGLSIVKKLMQAMNGQLACESAVGRGATFIIRLPQSTSNTR